MKHVTVWRNMYYRVFTDNTTPQPNGSVRTRKSLSSLFRQVLVDWILVPAESITQLIGDGLTSILLDANRPEDVDADENGGALIRTLRPIKEVHSCLSAVFFGP